ncbi:hypothetical protein [Gaiella occulta]|uniref:hypothetical protein n=1 Tax=Gaiella occulta TaxID=1002870 RepID=UPI000E0B8649|nr:hypothetical protein [Gaiella occulta]
MRREAGDAVADAAKLVITPSGGRRWDDMDVMWRVAAQGCCEVCDRHHGLVLTLAELEEQVMPLGGPVHGCERGGGCGCRAMPASRA